MPDLQWNKSTWAGSYDWSGAGDEWSGPWGTSTGEWYTTILPRIAAALPCQRILEIAPGFGRWTQFLLPLCDTYVGVDLSEECIKACRQRFEGRPNAEWHVNDGRSLGVVDGRQFDFVFSFDSLVHADWDAVGHYVPQVVRLLAPGGLAFLHHSNLGAEPAAKVVGHRSTDVSPERVRETAERVGGKVLVQERISWTEDVLSDCFTLL